MRNWLINLIREALFKDLVEIENRLALLTTEYHTIHSTLQRLVDFHQAKVYEEDEEKKQGNEVPLQQSRPSWMRMKKQFEERDVRNLIAQEQAERQEFTGRSNTATRRAFNEEADRVASYWTDKQKGI